MNWNKDKYITLAKHAVEFGYLYLLDVSDKEVTKGSTELTMGPSNELDDNAMVSISTLASEDVTEVEANTVNMLTARKNWIHYKTFKEVFGTLVIREFNVDTGRITLDTDIVKLQLAELEG